MDTLRYYNRYRKTPKFKNRAYVAAIIFLFANIGIQSIFFFR